MGTIVCKADTSKHKTSLNNPLYKLPCLILRLKPRSIIGLRISLVRTSQSCCHDSSAKCVGTISIRLVFAGGGNVRILLRECVSFGSQLAACTGRLLLHFAEIGPHAELFWGAIASRSTSILVAGAGKAHPPTTGFCGGGEKQVVVDAGGKAQPDSILMQFCPSRYARPPIYALGQKQTSGRLKKKGNDSYDGDKHYNQCNTYPVYFNVRTIVNSMNLGIFDSNVDGS
jgi:hypothetical protein